MLNHPWSGAPFPHFVCMHFAHYYFMFRSGDHSVGCFGGKTKSWLVSAPIEARNRFRYFTGLFWDPFMAGIAFSRQLSTP